MKIDWKRLTAEFLIIIAGIMLALAADRWQQGKRDDDLAADYIVRLAQDIEADIRSFAMTDDWSRAIDAAAVNVTGVYRGREVPKAEYELLVHDVLRGSWLQLGTETSATYIDLISTGNLGLLPVDSRNWVNRYYSLKDAYSGRGKSFEEKLSRGYWNVPARVLGPDLLPKVWLAVQGTTPDFALAPGSLELSAADIEAVIASLRAIEDLEKQTADVRHFMVQRQVIFGARLPNAARELLVMLEAAAE